MSSKSNTQGRAYEYAFIMSLAQTIAEYRPVSVEETTSLEVCRAEWNSLTDDQKNIYGISAMAAIIRLFKLEPKILENDGDAVSLCIQPDSAGEDGDVRDILIIRNSIKWEIGLSLKHNSFAVKHSRLATNLDFGNSWFEHPCSSEYWDDVKPIFSYLSVGKEKKMLFSQIENKEDEIYIPILKAFQREIERIFKSNQDAPAKLVEYLIGRYDFYKVISVDSKSYTCIQAVNIRGTLNTASKAVLPEYVIPRVKLPTRLIHIGFVPNSKTTVELYLDGGW